MADSKPTPQTESNERINKKVERFLGLLKAEEERDPLLRFGISFNSESSESSESSETSETSETSEMHEMPRMLESLRAVDPNPDSWSEILRVAEPVFTLLGVTRE
jgi:hypothetical protein